MSRPKFFPFQLKLCVNECHSGLPQFWAVIQLIAMRIFYIYYPILTRRIDKVKWITAHNGGKPKWYSFTPNLSWKETMWVLTLSHKMCPRKQTTEPKLVIMVSLFSGEVTSSTDTSYCIHILWEVCLSVFFWATLYRQFLIITLCWPQYNLPFQLISTQFPNKLRFW